MLMLLHSTICAQNCTPTSVTLMDFYLTSSIRTAPINWGFFLAIQFYYLFVLAGATTLCVAIAGLLLGTLGRSQSNVRASPRDDTGGDDGRIVVTQTRPMTTLPTSLSAFTLSHAA